MDRDDDNRSPFEGLVDDDDDDSSMEFLQELSADDAEEGEPLDGLELDDHQSVELRNIFLTTLPQYLEPVEEMVVQLFSSAQPDEATRATLSTTLESIRTAAARIGLDDVSTQLDRMCLELAQLAGGSTPPPEAADMEEVLAQSLLALRRMSGGAAGTPEDTGPARETGPRAQTLFAALRGAEGIDDSVLERFTSAGLVTVDQLAMASQDEIVAVSGLPAEVVARVMATLGLEGKRPRGSEAPSTRGDRTPTPNRDPQAEAALEEGGLRGEVARGLRTRVEREASIEELRTALQRTRTDLTRRRREVEDVRARASELRLEVAKSDEATLGVLAALASVRSEHAELEERKRALTQELRTTERHLAELDASKRAALEEHRRFAEEMAELQLRMTQLLESVPVD